jgi:predicted PurR-regulated permease PerM
MVMHFFKYTLLPAAIQIAVMLTDILILVAITAFTLRWGLSGFIIAVLLAMPGVQATGGFFYSWKPSVIKSFFENWRIDMR